MTASDPPAPDRLLLAKARVIDAARAEGRARRVLQGAPVGPVLDARMSEFVTAASELHRAIDALHLVEGEQT